MNIFAKIQQLLQDIEILFNYVCIIFKYIEWILCEMNSNKLGTIYLVEQKMKVRKTFLNFGERIFSDAYKLVSCSV